MTAQFRFSERGNGVVVGSIDIDLGGGVGELEVGFEAVIDGPPGLASIVGAEGAGGGDGGVEAAAVTRSARQRWSPSASPRTPS